MTDQERLDNVSPIGYKDAGENGLDYLVKEVDYFYMQEMAQKFIDQAELLERYKQALEEIFELSKHDCESRYLDKCYVVANQAIKGESE